MWSSRRCCLAGVAVAALLAPAPSVAARAQAGTTVALYPEATSIPPVTRGVHTATAGEGLVAAGTYLAGTTGVVLQVRSGGGAWRATGPAANRGPETWWLQLRAPATRGHWWYRVLTTGRHPSVSPAWALDVVRASNGFMLATSWTTGPVRGRGSAEPARPGTPVDVQVLRAGLWRDVARVLQDGNGGYRFAVLPPGDGRWRYRTVVRVPGTYGSTAREVLVRPGGAWSMPAAGLDPLYGSIPPAFGADAVQLTRSGTDAGALRWALRTGTRTFAATLRAVPGRVGNEEVVRIRTDRRTYLITTLAPGSPLPVSLDVSGAAWLAVEEYPTPSTELADSHVLLTGPRFTAVPEPPRGPDPDVRYLTDLAPVGVAGCVAEVDVSYAAARPRPASIEWGGLFTHGPCSSGDTIAYDLGERFSRLRGTVANPDLGGLGADLVGGVVTVSGDGAPLATIATDDPDRSFEVDVTGVQTLRIAFGPQPGEQHGHAAVLTPALTLP